MIRSILSTPHSLLTLALDTRSRHSLSAPPPLPASNPIRDLADMMRSIFSLVLLALACVTLAVPFPNATNASELELMPWTSLGINAQDAANFATSGVSPMEGVEIIAAEEALFNGTVTRND